MKKSEVVGGISSIISFVCTLIFLIFNSNLIKIEGQLSQMFSNVESISQILLLLNGVGLILLGIGLLIAIFILAFSRIKQTGGKL